jgi:hypothetical protein
MQEPVRTDVTEHHVVSTHQELLGSQPQGRVHLPRGLRAHNLNLLARQWLPRGPCMSQFPMRQSLRFRHMRRRFALLCRRSQARL